MHSLPFEEAWSCVLEDPVGGTEVGGVVPEGEIPPEDPPEVSLLDEFSALVAGLAETWVITESIGASLNSRRPMESRDIPGFTSENLKLSSLQKSRQIYKLHDFISGLFSMQNVFSRVFGKTNFHSRRAQIISTFAALLTALHTSLLLHSD